jgi:gliding motility-associated-like protein
MGGKYNWARGALFTLCILVGANLPANNHAPRPVKLRGGDIQLPATGTLPASMKPGRTLFLLQFAEIPGAAERSLLERAGIQLYDYIPEYTWYAEIPAEAAGMNLQLAGVVGLSTLKPEWKTEPLLWHNGGPEWAQITGRPGWIDVTAYLANDRSYKQVEEACRAQGFECYEHVSVFTSFQVRLPFNRLHGLLSVEGIVWVEPKHAPVESHNLPGRINHRALPLNVGRPGGRDLWGEGIVIGEWDGAGIGAHVDYNSRIINKQAFVAGANGNHATHVCGTITGGGIMDPFAQGMAPKAFVFGWDFAGNIPAEMDTACRRDSIVMTNNSYGYSSDPCATRGTYDGISRNLDILVSKYPYLSHQFSSGNSRANNCAPGGYRTINGGFQAAKNNITVGALQWNDGNSTFHSYGPMRDGRMKPEVCGVGVNVYSTLPNNTYAGGWNGTSMSCPGVTGTMALLYERFQQLNGRRPLNHTLKAIVCNTSDDLGTTGPDYAYGFGRINAISALESLEKVKYKVDSVSNGGLWTDTVYVAPGTARLQVMLVWDDVPAAVGAAPSLVNDLDLEIADNNGNTMLPWTLDPSCHTCAATRKRDSLNNAEQFYVNNPASGYWVIRVKGKTVTTTNEVFTVSTLQWGNFVRVAHPNGLESMAPPSTGAPQTISWDAYGTTSTFTLEYSADSGATWNTIATGVSNATRHYTWNNAPGGLNTRKALVRVRNGVLSDISDTTFHIFTKSFEPDAVLCDRQIHLYWRPTPGAARYTVLQSINSFMEPIGTTEDTFFTVFNLNNGQQYWFSLQAINADGAIGPRTNGKGFTPAATPAPPSIATEPLSQVICDGNTLLLESKANGTAPFFRQWQISTDSGQTWNNLPGETGDTLSISPFTWAQRGLYFRNRYHNVCRNRIFTQAAAIGVDTPIRFLNTLNDLWICEGDSIKLNIDLNSATRPHIQWERSTDNGMSWSAIPGDTLKTLALNNLMYGNNLNRFRLSASNYCETNKKSDTAILHVHAPLRVLIPQDTTICYGIGIDLIAAGTGGDSTRYLFNWDGFAAGNTIQVQPLSTTVYRVNLDDQCSYADARDSIVVTVRQPLAITWNNDTTICLGRTVNLQATLNGGRNSTYTYTWMPGNLNGSSVNVSPQTSTQYSVTAYDGCTPDTMRVNIQVNVREALDIRLNRDTLICMGTSVNLNALLSGGLGSSHLVSWDQGLGSGSNKTVQPMTKTRYTAILSDGCTVKNDTAAIEVDVRAPLRLTLSDDTLICQGRSTALEATASGGRAGTRNIQWDNGLPDGDLHIVNPALTTTYRAILSDACTVLNDTQYVVISVRDPLDIRSNRDTTLCFGNPISLTTLASGGTGTYTYTWQNTATPFPALGNGNSLNLNPVSTLGLRVILSDACTVKDDTALVLIRVLPNLQLRSSPDTAVCAGNTAGLRGRTLGGTGNYQYTWTDLNDASNPGNDSTLMVIPASSRMYRVQVTDGCTVTQPNADISVQVVPMPVADFSTPENILCDPGLFALSNRSSAATRYRLGNSSYSGNDTSLLLRTGNHNIRLMAYNSLGCADSAFLNLTVHPSPVAGFVFIPVNPREAEMVNFTDNSSGATSWSWWLPHGNFNTQSITPWQTRDSGVWNLRQIVKNSDNCADTFETNIRVGIGYYLFAPSAFTPNGDGLNDVWIPTVRGARMYSMKIYNRWGEMVFSTDDPSKGWSPENPQEGVYAFFISLINAYDIRYTEKGNITLMK